MLTRMFSVSRQTARHALEVLDGEGLLLRRQGSGTFLKSGRFDEVRKRRKIAVITTYIDSYIFPKMLKGIESTLYNAGYLLQISYTNNTFSRETMILTEIAQNDEVAGIIIEGTKSSMPDPNIDILRSLQEKCIPILFINCRPEGIQAPLVSLDDREAAYAATEYLIKRGHKNIAGIFKLDDGQGRLRYAGYREALLAYNLPIRDEQILWYDTTDMNEWMEGSTGSPLKRAGGCTALMCYNDQMASCVLQYKPDDLDLSIISIDNSELATMCSPHLTGVDHPKEELGHKAAELILEMLRNETKVQDYFFAPVICERDSVKNL